MFAVARTPLASPTFKHAFTHAKAFPFHVPSLSSPGLGSPMQMTPMMSPTMLVPATHVFPSYNNLPASPKVTTPMSPAMLGPSAHVLPNGRITRPYVDWQFTMPAYPFPAVAPEASGSTSTPRQPKTRPSQGPARLSRVASGKITKSGRKSALKRKANLKLRLNPEAIVINEEDLLTDRMRLVSIEEDQGIEFGGFKSIKERVPTPFPATQRSGGVLRELDAIDLWLW
ncbi:hypothetical protein OE88DRAFT_1460282 [Heliocybe sulcata]|uniref:Uncharacterized protein n=1 Tax=Heliocybe sulcata TaxID=5364 RepID=A0A5C3N6J4_9AGAM|nr:hypothetical protein OE88DRAFT_1460282 [Heliocybe sulcata]